MAGFIGTTRMYCSRCGRETEFSVLDMSGTLDQKDAPYVPAERHAYCESMRGDSKCAWQLEETQLAVAIARVRESRCK